MTQIYRKLEKIYECLELNTKIVVDYTQIILFAMLMIQVGITSMVIAANYKLIPQLYFSDIVFNVTWVMLTFLTLFIYRECIIDDELTIEN